MSPNPMAEGRRSSRTANVLAGEIGGRDMGVGART